MRPSDRRTATLDSVLQCRTGHEPGPGGLDPSRIDLLGPRARSPAGVNVPGRLFAGPGAYASPGGGVSSSTKAAKEYKLPDPETGAWSGHLARYPKISKLPLYEKGSAPKYDQVLQQAIANCYLAATLAALANTPSGVKLIRGMIVEHAGSITTICKQYDGSTVGAEQKIQSDRWFTVSFAKESVDVSDVLYHDDSDHDPNLRYLTTPKSDKAIWGAIIEVAYASLKKGYDNISSGAGNSGINQFFDEFSTTKWTILDPKENDKINKACSNARARAALIATKSQGTTKLTGWHGYAVVGMNGSKVKLWDPLKGGTEEIAFKDLLAEIQAAIVAQA